MKIFHILLSKTTLKLWTNFGAAALISALLWFTGCAQADPTPSSGSAEFSLDGAEFVVGTLSPGSDYNIWALAAASIIDKHSKMMVTPIPAPSSVAFPEMLGTGEFHITPITHIDNYQAYNGIGKWDGNPQKHLRLVAGGGFHNIGIFTDKNSGIETYHDLKGKRFTWDTVGAGTTKQFGLAALEALKLDPYKDVIHMQAEHVAPAWNDLAEGRTDATSNVTSTQMVEEAAVRITPFLLPLPEPEIVEAILEICPYFHIGEIELDYAEHIAKGTPTFQQRHFIQTSVDVDEALIYEWVNRYIDNWDEILNQNPRQLQYWGPDRMVVLGNIPYHEGAIKAYKERGMWSEEMEQYQARVSK